MESDVITMQELYRFRQQHIEKDNKVVGVFEATGVRPVFYEAFKANGVAIPDIFDFSQ